MATIQERKKKNGKPTYKAVITTAFQLLTNIQKCNIFAEHQKQFQYINYIYT